jgi:hypothetical protein
MNLRGFLSPVLIGLMLCSGALSREATAAEGRELRGALYALGSRQRVKLYTWEMRVCPELWTSRYRRLDGALVVEDFTRFSRERLVEHWYVRHAISERASVRVDGRRVEFRYQRGVHRKSATLTTDGAFLTGPAVFPFIQQHWAGLLRGEEVEIDYGVLDRLDYFSFVLSSPSTPTDREVIVRIRAASLFVRMAIDTIEVRLSRAGQFKGIRGRTIIMELSGERLVPIDADLVVEAERSGTCMPATRAEAPTRSRSTKGE